MRVMVGLSIWNKVDMISWMLDGVIKNFPNDRTHVHAVFDNPTDGTDAAFQACAPWWLSAHGFSYSHETTDKQVFEVGGHDRLIQKFLQSDCDFLVIPQDDQKFNQSIFPALEMLFSKYGEKLGIIGGRDGFFKNYVGMVSSPFSESTKNTKLPFGQFEERPYFNSGPIIYTKKVVQTVGSVNTNFKAFYIWDEYGYRATNSGFTNILLSMDITHIKFGRISSTQVYAEGISTADINLLHVLCPRL